MLMLQKGKKRHSKNTTMTCCNIM